MVVSFIKSVKTVMAIGGGEVLLLFVCCGLGFFQCEKIQFYQDFILFIYNKTVCGAQIVSK